MIIETNKSMIHPAKYRKLQLANLQHENLIFFDDGHTPGNIKACRQVPLRTPRKVIPMLAIYKLL